MRKNDVRCSECGAGFRRLELSSLPNEGGEYRCPSCGNVVERFDGKDAFIAYRLTVESLPKAAHS
jgi:predicted Zn finger-like uncharacterized protein